MRAYYSASRAQFDSHSDAHILGELTTWHSFATEQAQTSAWRQQIAILRVALKDIPDFTLFFEFAIPRMGKRADTVVLIGDTVFVIEFKVGSEAFDRHALEQVEDYALDLKNFHQGSHDLSIVPVLVATRAEASRDVQMELAFDLVSQPLSVTSHDLGEVLRLISARHRPGFDAGAWAASGYRPTPTIVEAARALYANHSVEDITRSGADDLNLGRTQDAISAVIETSRARNLKSICFITGVPGAGKTLAGLTVATRRQDGDASEHATYLTGNGPLVEVLREALARDTCERTGVKKANAARSVAAFIQNIHNFRDDYAGNDTVPSDHVVVFDEAQRAWTRAQASKFMQAKRNIPDFDMSEPEFLLSVMDRHADWCTVVCLIGGGQEINTGEAGLSEWMTAIRDHFPHWRVHVSDQIEHPDYDLRKDAKAFLASAQVTPSPDLHLGVSMRSFRAETLSDFISHVLGSHVLGGDRQAAHAAADKLDKYPLMLTRDLAAARDWLKSKARGTERYGLVASSGAHRLRPEGLHIKAAIDPANWFLNDRSDVRSSFALEEAASEFDIQGLELDWTGVCWDADLRYDGGWRMYNFKGTRWQSINDDWRKLYLKNAYRVILTRARQGIVVFVPKGDETDATRPPHFYDGTYEYLKNCGFQPL
ncbi:DUF2075 domain-containing protein [Asticcacaulis solisilvae]|uniref:DUF2075 domain-containing protein n=1 Tax=Asticcacaulis solisilvae TaxID=1217274 RepID=UPI003FD7D01A